MKRPYYLFVVVFIILSPSCSTVKQNGYYQTRKYKSGNNKITLTKLFQKSVKEKSEKRTFSMKPIPLDHVSIPASQTSEPTQSSATRVEAGANGKLYEASTGKIHLKNATIKRASKNKEVKEGGEKFNYEPISPSAPQSTEFITGGVIAIIVSLFLFGIGSSIAGGVLVMAGIIALLIGLKLQDEDAVFWILIGVIALTLIISALVAASLNVTLGSL